jgi:hypothetical protein
MASELRVTTIANNAGSESVGTTYVVNGSAKQRARVDQNNATQNIEESFNVASVTDGGAGQTRFNFTNNMSTALYTNLGIAGSTNRFCIANSPTTAGAKITVYSVSGQTANDSTHVFNSVHGDLA